ncbi:type VI secretion system baseplate subunit TssE [Silvimonas iriomotensis]|uniref:IraD/Gp25-like domain-containing protein n=1 Tax=Silvimonas iriomotensis TaxID=449662 RepID=A0ABQ2P4X8_9NEIS|nr:type VI secretion system baseplate subunit TssE [Silvimonas iriomotensis]GGP18188.1 hypothetical protein GCM10010970_03620 [Silvimonas iriomotensis]
MSGPGLYERLLGSFADGTPVDEYDDKTQTILSVMDNIQCVLNTRAGSLSHLPEYGLPDLTSIYRELPASAHRLKRMIESTLLQYEPRLQAIEIELKTPDDEAMLSYMLICHLKQTGLVRFGTWFMPDGRVRLRRHSA